MLVLEIRIVKEKKKRKEGNEITWIYLSETAEFDFSYSKQASKALEI